ncbi:MAG TPA: hypothetical protein VF699_09960 [Caulobacteraceae bacterium]|jgi:hypothetical protein
MTVRTDTTSTGQLAGTTAESTEQAAPPQGGVPDDGTTQTPDPDASGDGRDGELPEWARKRLTRANAEAANYRTRLREAEARLDGAQTPEQFEAAVADIKTRNAELEQQITRERVARKYHLPDDLAARLRGTTAQELEADAKALQKYAAPAEPVVLSGGLNPADDSDAFDPVKEARRARARRF